MHFYMTCRLHIPQKYALQCSKNISVKYWISKMPFFPSVPVHKKKVAFFGSISLYASDRLPIFRSVSLIDLFTDTAAILN